jgi:dienelactone hydrolase
VRRLTSCLVALFVLTAAPAAAVPTFAYAPAPPGEAPAGAVVVRPEKPGASMPAVLWVHWLGEPATTNHTEFLADARALAARGVVSLLVDMPWSQKDWFTAVRTPEHDYDDIVAQVISLRRALDYLTALPGVDRTRIAYVGHDFGAMDGALLLAVDDRPRFAVLMTPTLSFWEWNLLGKQPADRDAYVAQMSAFDLPGWLARGRQSATLLQFADRDAFVSRATASTVRNAVPNRDRTLERYDADHALEVPAAHDDRRAWLMKRLGLGVT